MAVSRFGKLREAEESVEAITRGQGPRALRGEKRAVAFAFSVSELSDRARRRVFEDKRRRRAPGTRRGAGRAARAGRTRVASGRRVSHRRASHFDRTRDTPGDGGKRTLCGAVRAVAPATVAFAGLAAIGLRGRPRPPSVPTTSPSNSRGARGWRAPPVRLAPPAGPEYDQQGRHGGSETDGGDYQGLGDQRGFDVIRRASRVPAFRSSRIGSRVRVAASGPIEKFDRGRSRRCGKGVEHAPDLSACLAGLAAAGLAAACAGARAAGLGPSSSSRRANMFAPEKAMVLGSNGAFGERLVP